MYELAEIYKGWCSRNSQTDRQTLLPLVFMFNLLLCEYQIVLSAIIAGYFDTCKCVVYSPL